MNQTCFLLRKRKDERQCTMRKQVAARDSASLPDTLTELTAATALRILLAWQNEPG